MSRGELNDLVDQVTTKAHGQKPAKFSYIGLEHIEPGARTLTAVAPSSVSQSTNGVFIKGDILFGKLRPNLRKAVQVDCDGFCSTDFLILRPKSGTNARYAAHAVASESVFRHAERNSIGTRMPRTSWLAVSRAPIWVPPLEEQRRIAEILDSIDETVRVTERIIAKHKRIRSGLASDLLTGKFGRILRETQQSSDVTQSCIPRWERRQLGDIGTVVGGGTPPRENRHCWGDFVPWLTPGELTDSKIKFVSKTKEKISARGLADSGARVVPKGSLMVTSRASIGFCALAGTPMTTNQGFKNLIPGTDVDSSFLLMLGRTLQREMVRRASGTTFLEISKREFERIEIDLPPLEEQRWIAEILDSIDETIRSNEEQRGKLRQIRSGLADDLLSGRVRTVAQ